MPPTLIAALNRDRKDPILLADRPLRANLQTTETSHAFCRNNTTHQATPRTCSFTSVALGCNCHQADNASRIGCQA